MDLGFLLCPVDLSVAILSAPSGLNPAKLNLVQVLSVTALAMTDSVKTPCNGYFPGC